MMEKPGYRFPADPVFCRIGIEMRFEKQFCLKAALPEFLPGGPLVLCLVALSRHF